jgi:hypothetical protein
VLLNPKKLFGMKRLPVLLSLAAASMAFASCQKEVEELNNPSESAAIAETASRPSLLAAASWHQTGLTVSTATAGVAEAASSDLFSQLKPAMIIKSASYKTDGSYTVLNGARPGSLEAPQQAAGSWQLNAAGDSLTVTMANEASRKLAVTELTASTLKLSYSNAASNGSVSTYTSVFAH